MKKTQNKWKTDCCRSCCKPHSGYTGKLDKNFVEYVVCGDTHKRCNIIVKGKMVWEKDNDPLNQN